jgi:hypothetical protein
LNLLKFKVWAGVIAVVGSIAGSSLTPAGRVFKAMERSEMAKDTKKEKKYLAQSRRGRREEIVVRCSALI